MDSSTLGALAKPLRNSTGSLIAAIVSADKDKHELLVRGVVSRLAPTGSANFYGKAQAKAALKDLRAHSRKLFYDAALRPIDHRAKGPKSPTVAQDSCS